MALALSLSLMVLDHRFHHLQSVRSALSVVTYPLQWLADLPASAIHWISLRVSDQQSLLEENRTLREELLKLQATLQKHESLLAENLRLRNLLESSFKVGDRVLVAELSAMDLDPYRQQITIKKGSASGIFEGQPVLDAHAK